MSQAEQLRLDNVALRSSMSLANESSISQQYVIKRLRADLATCVAALQAIIECDLDKQGTAAAAIWNNGQPLGKL